MPFRLRANEPASPPRSRRKKRFILTNSESLQQGWPFLSKLVYHTEAYVPEQGGYRQSSDKCITQRERISHSEQPGCQRYLPTHLGSRWQASTARASQPSPLVLHTRGCQRAAGAQCGAWTRTAAPLSIPLSKGFVARPFSLERG